jgi:hypothetical protein
MKTLFRTLCLTAALIVSVLAVGHGDEEEGTCYIRCSDGSQYQYSCVTYPRCRVRFNELCGGVGHYEWVLSTTCL